MPPEPSAALFFFADVLPFFVRAALGTFFDGAAAARHGAGATPPVVMVIRGGKKRLCARPTLGGAPAVARGKKLAGRSTAAAATKAPASSLVEPAADAHHVFDEMPQGEKNSNFYFLFVFQCIITYR